MFSVSITHFISFALATWVGQTEKQLSIKRKESHEHDLTLNRIETSRRPPSSSFSLKLKVCDACVPNKGVISILLLPAPNLPSWREAMSRSHPPCLLDAKFCCILLKESYLFDNSVQWIQEHIDRNIYQFHLYTFHHFDKDLQNSHWYLMEIIRIITKTVLAILLRKQDSWHEMSVNWTEEVKF